MLRYLKNNNNNKQKNTQTNKQTKKNRTELHYKTKLSKSIVGVPNRSQNYEGIVIFYKKRTATRNALPHGNLNGVGQSMPPTGASIAKESCS